MKLRSLIVIFAVLLAAPLYASEECPMCDQIDAWFAENGGTCFYHGNRISSVCDYDDECQYWNRICAEKNAELQACIQRCMAPLPSSQALDLDDFERDMADLERTGFDPDAAQQSAGWCHEARSRMIAASPQRFAGGVIGRIVAAKNDTRLGRCTADDIEAAQGIPVRLGDCIETGPNSSVRMITNLEIGSGPDFSPGSLPDTTFIDIGNNSRVCFDNFEVYKRQSPAMAALINLMRGAVKVFYDGWSRRPFYIRVSGVVAAIGGSEVNVHITGKGAVQVAVIEGHAWLGNLRSREMRRLSSGQWAQDDPRLGMSQIDTLTREMWDSVMVRDGLMLDGGRFERIVRACQPVIGRWQWADGTITAHGTDGSWRTGDGRQSGLWRCNLNGDGAPELVLNLEGDRWLIRAVIDPDGQRMSGYGDNGIASEAVRVFD